MANPVSTFKVELTAGVESFVKGFSQAGSVAGEFGKAIGGISFTELNQGLELFSKGIGLVAAGFSETIGKTLEYADAIGTASERTGHSVEWLQAVGFAALQSGTDIEQVTKASEKLARALGEGTDDARKAVAALGLSFEQLRTSSPDQQMDAVLKALSGVSDMTARTTLAMQLLGKSGGALLPLVGDYEKLTARARDLGDVIETKDIVAAKRLKDSLSGMESTFGSLIANLGITITSSEGVHQAVAILTDALGSMSRWVAANREELRAFVVDGLVATIKGFESVLVGIGYFNDGFLAIEKAVIAASGYVARFALQLETVAKIAQHPLDAKSYFSAYEAESKALDAVLAGQVRRAQETHDVVGNALVSGVATTERMAEALDTLGKSEVKVGEGKGAVHILDISKASAEAEKELKALADGMKAFFDDISKRRAAQEGLMNLLGPGADDATIEMGRLSDAAEKLGGVTQLTDEQLVKLITDLQAQMKLGGTNAWGFTTVSDAMQEVGNRSGAVAQRVGFMADVAVKGAKDAEAAHRKLAEQMEHLKEITDEVGGAFQILGEIGKDVGGKLGSAMQQIGDFGSNIAEGFATGDFTKAFDQAIGFIVKGIGSLFHKEEQDVNKLRDSFISAHGGWQALQASIAKATNQDLLKKLFDAKTVTAYNAAMNEITKTLGLWDDAQQGLDDAMQQYGITIGDLGPTFAKQKLDEQAGALLKDYELLNAAGVDQGLIIQKMGGDLNAYVQESLKAGTAIPEAMRPVLEQMIAQGQLLDANGQAYTSLDQAGITFAQSQTEAFQNILDAIYALVKVLGGEVPAAFDKAGDAAQRNSQRMRNGVPSGGAGNADTGAPPDQNAEPRHSYALGTDGYQWFGSGTAVTLHGWEAVVPREKGSFAGGMGGTTTINVSAPINENPLQTFEGVQRQRAFTLDILRRDVMRDLARAVAEGKA